MNWEELTPEMIEAIGVPVQEAENSSKQTNAVIMYETCHDLNVIPFRAEDIGGVYVRFPVGGHWEIDELKSSRFKAWLTKKFFINQGADPKRADIDGALLLLESDAFEMPKRKTFTRLAKVGTKIFMDLCNDAYEAVEIDSDGWRIVGDSPVWFMRSQSMKALPIPQEGGSLNQLRSFTNLGEEDFILTVGWLIAAANPDGPFPLLALSSEHGSGKSTLTTLLQRILDPNSTERLAAFKDADALFSTAASRWVMPYDNLGKINEENSNHLCRLATGGGYAKRQLYTNNDSYSITVKRPVIMNGIALTLGRMDLLDRAYMVKLSAIPDGGILSEDDLYSAFEKEHPEIFGALLSAISAALKETNYKPNNLPRMADAATFVLRAEKGGGLPWPEGTFAEVLMKRDAEKRDDAIMDDPVASQIIRLVEDDDWEGTLKRLLQLIHEWTDIEERPFLPKLPRTLSGKLEQLAPFLRSKGIKWVSKKMEYGIRLTVTNTLRTVSTRGASDGYIDL